MNKSYKTSKNSRFLRLRSVWILSAIASTPIYGLAPLTGTDAGSHPLILEWKAESADRALKSGLVSLAEDQYRQVLSRVTLLPEELLEDSIYGLAAALIAQSDFAEASTVLADIEAKKSSRYLLFKALIDYGERRFGFREKVSEILGEVEVGSLQGANRAWFHFLRGVLAQEDYRLEQANKFFELAKSTSSSPEQIAFFEALILRQRILSMEDVDEKLLATVRERVDDLRGRPGAYAYVLEYGLLLNRLGRAEDAVEALDAEINGSGNIYSGDERSQLLLLKSMILGVKTDAGLATLKEIVRSGRGRAAMAISLQLLVRTVDSPSEMLSFLSQVIAQAQSHPLIVQLYYLRAQMALSNPETASIAEADARILLEQYPGARELEDVYGLLAYAALQRRPAQYRAAAEYLARLKEAVDSAEEGFRINRLIGDCYFMNGDFANAVDFYRIADRERGDSHASSKIFLRLAVAEMRAGELDRATRYVDRADSSGVIDQTQRWMAEWNISQALLKQGAIDRARDRVAGLLSAERDDPVPTTLDLRLRWLALHLQLEAGETEGLAAEVSELQRRVEAVPERDEASTRQEIDLLKTEIIVLLANAMLAEGKADEGFQVLAELRQNYPKSEAAERTFLAEGSYHASIGDFRAAQSALVELADSYPDGGLAAQALFEAALYCERRGPAHFGEAIVLLDRLVESYPNRPMVYYAGLKQGDLLRLMNDFASAQLLFENLINTYPEHPMRHVAELAYADCLVALSADNSSELAEAGVILERLLDLPNLSNALQVEIGYKLGLVFQRRGALAEARDTFTLMATGFLLDSDRVPELGSVGQYWLSRIVFELGSILEGLGESGEARRLYRKMIAFNLPGRSIASERLGNLPIP